MKLLFLTPQLPYPPRQGAAIRNWHLISGLAPRHEISLLSFGADMAVLAPLHAVCRRVEVVAPPHRRIRQRLRTLALTDLPDMARRLWSPDFIARLRTLLAEEAYDWVQIEGIELAPYAREILALGPRGQRPRWLFDDHNAEYLLQRRAFEADVRRPPAWLAALYSFVQWQRLWHYERVVCREANAVVAVSDPDRAALRALDPQIAVTVVPNGVDLAAWSVRAAGKDRDADRLTAVGPLVVFDGSMDFRPNVDAVHWFVHRVWPLVRQAAPLAQFAIVGRNPTRRVQALEAERGVVVIGAVADTRPWVAAADVYVVPMRIGGGVRLKVLQALAMERAIVSTTLGCEGINVTDGTDVLLADDPADFAGAVAGLLESPLRAAMLGRAACLLAAAYAWDRIVPRLESVLSQPE